MSVMKTIACQLLVAPSERFCISRASKYTRALSTKRPSEDEYDVIKSNPYFDKYAEKINLKKEATPEDVQKRLIALLEKKKPKVQTTRHVQNKTKKLDDLISVDSFYHKLPSEVKVIWDCFSQDKHIFTTSMPSDIYKKIEKRGKIFPTFLFPLPRAMGFEYIVSQFSGQEVHFSPLINYKKFKENAPECLAVTHFTDVEDATKLVLVHGEFNTDILDRTDALCLYHQLQRYYGEEDPHRLKMIDQFTNAPHNFYHMDLIAELDCLKPAQI